MTRSQNKLAILSLQFYTYPDEIGGAWKYTYEVNKRLAQRGHRVETITCKPHPGLPDEETIDGILYHRIGVEESKHAVSLARALKKKIGGIRSRSGIGLVHVHNPLVGFLAWAGGGLSGLPKVYHFHSLWFDEEKINRLGADYSMAPGSPTHSLVLGTRLNLIRLIEWTCFFTAARVLFLSEYSQKRFEAFYPFRLPPLRVIPGGVDTERFRPPKDSDPDARTALGLPTDRPILLTVRRLAERMGLENLIRAMAMVVERGPRRPFLLIIAGHGPLEKRLRSLIDELGLKDRVRMTGRVPVADLPQYYRAADLFLLPTARIEGFGLATVEALASGLPALGTPVGGTVEILRGIGDGLLFDNTSPKAIADRVEQFLGNPQPVTNLKSRCRETAVALYDWELVVDRLEKEFYSAAGAEGEER